MCGHFLRAILEISRRQSGNTASEIPLNGYEDRCLTLQRNSDVWDYKAADTVELFMFDVVTTDF